MRDLPIDLDSRALPTHVAAIMDGNGRWAHLRGQPRIFGHRQGADTLIELIHCCMDWGIQMLTVYAFSTENWKRPKLEVDFLMLLFEQILRSQLPELVARGMRFSFVGDLTPLPQSLQKVIQRVIAQTIDNTGLEFVMAINYGGQQEILRACQNLAAQVESGELKSSQIDNTLFEAHLYTATKPRPDLLIRTSGEMRLSNFLLWQIAYTELFFTDTFWPDFDRTEFHRALLAYQARDRRFGRVK